MGCRVRLETGLGSVNSSGSQSRARRYGRVRKMRARRLFAVVVLHCLGSISPVRAQIDNYGIWTANVLPARLFEFDTLTNARIGSAIAIGDSPYNAVFTPDGRFAYVVDTVGKVYVLDVVGRNLVATIPVGGYPTSLAFSPDGATLYVTSPQANAVTTISTATNQVVGSPITVNSGPVSSAVSPDGTLLYVINTSGSVSIVDTASRAVVGNVTLGSRPYAIVVSPDGSKIYVSNQVGNSVFVIDSGSRSVVATIPFAAWTNGMAISPDGSRLYVTTEAHQFVVINTATNTVLTQVTTPNWSTAVTVTPDGSRAYIGNALLLSVLDTATNTIIGSISFPYNGNIGTGFIGPNVLVAAGGVLSVGSDAALSALGFGQYINFNGGTLKFTGAFNSARTISLLAGGGTIDTNGFNATLSGQVINTGSLTKTGLGTLTLTGANTYTGATIVNGGVLDVEGTITGTSAVTVNAGGVLMGSGTIDPLVVTIAGGGTFAPGSGAPGSSTSIVGNLALQSGAIYLVQVDPSTASYANVTGSATLGGATVNAVFAGLSARPTRFSPRPAASPARLTRPWSIPICLRISTPR